MRQKKSLFLFILLILLLNSVTLFGKEPVKIRVAVVKDTREMTLSISGPFEIIDAWTKITLYHGKNLTPSKVISTDSGLKIRNMIFNTDGTLILSKKKMTVVNNR